MARPRFVIPPFLKEVIAHMHVNMGKDLTFVVGDKTYALIFCHDGREGHEFEVSGDKILRTGKQRTDRVPDVEYLLARQDELPRWFYYYVSILPHAESDFDTSVQRMRALHYGEPYPLEPKRFMVGPKHTKCNYGLRLRSLVEVPSTC